MCVILMLLHHNSETQELEGSVRGELMRIFTTIEALAKSVMKKLAGG
jgi:hypothetical protein